MKQINIKRKPDVLLKNPGFGNAVGLSASDVDVKTGRLYIGCIVTPNVAMVDLPSGKYIGQVKINDDLRGTCNDIIFDPVYQRVYGTVPWLSEFFYFGLEDEKVNSSHSGAWPTDMAVDDEGRVYVTETLNHSIALIEPGGENVSKRYPVEGFPVTLDYSGGKLYVGCQMSGIIRKSEWLDPREIPRSVVREIDVDNGNIIDECEVGRRVTRLCIDKKRSILYATNRSDDNVSVLDLDRFKEVRTLSCNCSPWGIDIDPETGRVFVCCYTSRYWTSDGQPSVVSAISPGGLDVIGNVTVGRLANYLRCRGGKVYVPSRDDGKVTVIDANSLDVVSILTGFGWSPDDMAFDAVQRRLFMPSHIDQGVHVVDTLNGLYAGRIELGGWAVGAAVNSASGKLYVSDMDAGSLAVFDMASSRRVATIPLGSGPNFIRRVFCRVAVDEMRNRVYATMCRDNAITIVDGHRDVLLARVVLGPPLPTDPWAYVRSWDMRVAINRNSGRAFVIDAHNMVLSSIDTEALRLDVQRDVKMLENPLRPPTWEDAVKINQNNLQNLAVDEKRDLVYLWSWIFEGAELKLKGRLDPALGTGVTAVDMERGHLYIHGPDGLAIVDAETHDLVGRIPMSDNPLTKSELRTIWGVDIKSNTVYVLPNNMTNAHSLEVYEINV